jgi:hypothetical protein
MYDGQKEEYCSALDAVQSLERLHAVGLRAVEQAMSVIGPGTGKRTDIVLPHVMNYVANFFRPLLEKIDTVDYTRQSRELKVAADYAARLMAKNYSPMALGQTIASELVAQYPTHGFVIDQEEAGASRTPSGNNLAGLGLNIYQLKGNVKVRFETIVSGLIPFLDNIPNVIGRITHV